MDAESKFSSHLVKLFLARASKSGLVNKLKLFSRMSTTRAKISLRNQGTHVRVALICSCGKR